MIALSTVLFFSLNLLFYFFSHEIFLNLLFIFFRKTFLGDPFSLSSVCEFFLTSDFFIFFFLFDMRFYTYHFFIFYFFFDTRWEHRSPAPLPNLWPPYQSGHSIEKADGHKLFRLHPLIELGIDVSEELPVRECPHHSDLPTYDSPFN